MGHAPPRGPDRPTRYEYLRDRYVKGRIDLSAFEDGVAELLERDAMDAKQPYPIPPPPGEVTPTSSLASTTPKMTRIDS